MHLVPAEAERRLQHGQHLAGERGGVGRPPHPDLDERELVPAEPGQGVAAADDPAEPAGDAAQQRVPGRVPERVVDVLEVVEIDEQHRDPSAVAPGQRQGPPEPVPEQGAVRQAGEIVVVRQVADAVLGLLALGDVVVDHDHHRRPVSLGPAQRPVGRDADLAPVPRVVQELARPLAVAQQRGVDGGGGSGNSVVSSSCEERPSASSAVQP